MHLDVQGAVHAAETIYAWELRMTGTVLMTAALKSRSAAIKGVI